MNVVIIKYNAGNIMSVEFALRRIGIVPEITDDINKIIMADKVIFPGVGEASTTMLYLKNKGLDKVIKQLKQPVLGICLGLQLMCKYSEEGDTECLGIFEETIKKFRNKPDTNYKIPQMGWNSIHNLKNHIFDKSLENQYVYFVHSYYAEIGANTIATTNYIINFSSALQKDNFFATQFHPEKSGRIGEQILKNFIDL
jgi:glutamine amidotransferase